MNEPKKYDSDWMRFTTTLVVLSALGLVGWALAIVGAITVARWVL